MTEKGYSFSHEACRQHFQKLRRESKKSRAAAVGGGGSSTGGTPRKQRVNTTPKSGKSAANGKAGYMTGPVQDDDEFAQFDQTPSKKRKFEKMKFEDVEDVPALRFKMENHEQIVDGQRYVDLEHEEYYD
ncbi:hypothetical protein PVAG01_07726 [Phlyctema vagabunda]|uniref:Uncharacterized protein n=1 Tax=Phlyctema vagabunda TaxID=108571 RepID=A0ABR4PE24_9HELO